ncbi:MAG TPA: NAD(P)H-binding protein [Planctomycetota bacterium]|nr:NAD(P)H-binding protein [Planctomycetota bacterium]
MSDVSVQESTEVRPDAVRRVAIVGEIPFAGRALAGALTASGAVARVLCPDSAVEAALKALPNSHNVELVEGDLGSPGAVSSVLKDVYGVCFLSPISMNGRIYRAKEHIDDVKAVVQAAELNALRKVVYHSAIGASVGANSRALQDAAAAEELVSKSRCEDFRVRTGPLMGRGDGFLTEIVQRAKSAAPFMTVMGYGATIVQPLAAEDFGRALAHIFTATSDAPANGLYALVGPETHTLLELTDSALEILDRKKLKFHAPLTCLKLASAVGGNAKFSERVNLLFDAFAVEQSDVAKLMGADIRLKTPSEIQRELVAG